jgi:hypothetical protein
MTTFLLNRISLNISGYSATEFVQITIFRDPQLTTPVNTTAAKVSDLVCSLMEFAQTVIFCDRLNIEKGTYSVPEG